MEWLLDNWMFIVAIIAAIVCVVTNVLDFSRQPSEEQLNKVKEWLLYAVTMAEKEFGGGTGQIKLRYTYDLFVSKFPWIAQMITFAVFSGLVDEALDKMKKMLESNKAAIELVGEKPAE